jgi:hypothetical protein
MTEVLHLGVAEDTSLLGCDTATGRVGSSVLKDCSAFTFRIAQSKKSSSGSGHPRTQRQIPAGFRLLKQSNLLKSVM